MLNNINELQIELCNNLDILNEIYEKESNNINLVSHIKDIEEMMQTINTKLENLHINYKNVGLSPYAIERINNNIVAKETLKPFIPLMLYYNMILQNNIE